MAPRSERFLCPVLHAERLHEDAVWEEVRTLLRTVERGQGRMTLFVSPFWALVEDRARHLGDRLVEIAQRGHEIAQHTHYYDWDGAPSAAYRKHTDLGDENVRRRLDQDRDFLVAAGFRPRGFVSGAWEWPPAVGPWLADHAFTYDSSARRFGHARPVDPGRDILEVPTTHSLRLAVRDLADGRLARHSLGTGGTEGTAAYSMYYAHDYDLARPGRNLVMRLVARWPRRDVACAPVARVAEAAAAHRSGRPHG